ncbi:translation initiation factor IF-2 [Corvus cornix cornix]|uniref:translation initiation factor IF-2 n=1 Tax=Corvus cornix cornix TaxID=932674 RepID=UPI00195059BF|nr:translation initiation factor IF-2 [Corvus cornix cornix]
MAAPAQGPSARARLRSAARGEAFAGRQRHPPAGTSPGRNSRARAIHEPLEPAPHRSQRLCQLPFLQQPVCSLPFLPGSGQDSVSALKPCRGLSQGPHNPLRSQPLLPVCATRDLSDQALYPSIACCGRRWGPLRSRRCCGATPLVRAGPQPRGRGQGQGRAVGAGRAGGCCPGALGAAARKEPERGCSPREGERLQRSPAVPEPGQRQHRVPVTVAGRGGRMLERAELEQEREAAIAELERLKIQEEEERKLEEQRQAQLEKEREELELQKKLAELELQNKEAEMHLQQEDEEENEKTIPDDIDGSGTPTSSKAEKPDESEQSQTDLSTVTEEESTN